MRSKLPMRGVFPSGSSSGFPITPFSHRNRPRVEQPVYREPHANITPVHHNSGRQIPNRVPVPQLYHNGSKRYPANTPQNTYHSVRTPFPRKPDSTPPLSSTPYPNHTPSTRGLITPATQISSLSLPAYPPSLQPRWRSCVYPAVADTTLGLS